MFLHKYNSHELHFAYCYRVYIRWQTKCIRQQTPLASLTSKILNQLTRPYGVRVLELVATDTDVRVIVSLQPQEAISTCVSKVKGRVSKWLREQLSSNVPAKLLSKGYFAVTVGKSRKRAIERYLATQPSHHHYDKRKLPPVFVEHYKSNSADQARLSSPNACVLARFHIVLATWHRRGVMGSAEGRAIASEWRRRQEEFRVAIIKVSVVPDHLHVAVRVHPSVSPAEVVVALMNSAQEVVQTAMIEAGVERLWALSAYVGSYGDLASPQLVRYMEKLKIE
jgi:REP element-mobilizing transposase RayT